MPSYILNLSSETDIDESDLAPNQAILKIDAATDTATLFCADSAGDDIIIPLGGARGAFIPDPAGAVTDQDDEARAAIVLIINVLIARGFIAAS